MCGVLELAYVKLAAWVTLRVQCTSVHTPIRFETSDLRCRYHTSVKWVASIATDGSDVNGHVSATTPNF
jgi:hypothetical protein